MYEESGDDQLEAGLPQDAPETITLDTLRHSSAHLLAAAVIELFPGAQYDVGPSIDDGFFYNFRLPNDRHFSDEDLESLEAQMQRKVKEKLPYVREIMDREDAKKLFATMDQPFKVDIIDRLPEDVTQVTVYKTGSFVDLCRGPHVPDTSFLRSFKLMRVAGVYWRGDEKNEQLQRVYGTAWTTKEELSAYLERLEEAKRRDHRKLGAELDLFSISEEVGGGLVLWHPKGGMLRQIIEDFWRAEHRRVGYDLVFTPHIADRSLWETSTHVNFYSENMFGPIPVEDKLFQLKPMSCPFHIMIFKNRMRSYKELPLRFAELGTVYRYERSGVLHGLLRVRGFTQDDAHIFCRPDQVNQEVGQCVEFALGMLKAFGFVDVKVYLSTRPAKSVGSQEDWDKAEAALKSELEQRQVAYTVQVGEGAFYGPKIDLTLVDALGREWQCGTVQYDFLQPMNFDLKYVAEDGTPQQPIMVHRALLGSVERFVGCLIEHYAGAFPLWLAPVQCSIALVQDNLDDVAEYARTLKSRLINAGIRVTVDDRPGERMQARIRDAELQKIPYVLTVGHRDVERGDDVIMVRDTRRGGQEALSVDAILAKLLDEVSTKQTG